MKMKLLSSVLAVTILVSLASGARTAERHESITVVDGPTIIGFASARVAADADSLEYASEAIAHLQFALSDVSKCLADLQPTIDQQFADVITWKVGDERFTLELSDDPHEQVGAVLIKPGSKARTVYASVGPSSLLMLLPNAAAAYFGVPGCEVEP